MSEKEYQEEDLDNKESSSEKTIDLIEWQRKNAAYLEKRAQEKANQTSEVTNLEESSQEVDDVLSDTEDDSDMKTGEFSEEKLDIEEPSIENASESDNENEATLEADQEQEETEISLMAETKQDVELAVSDELSPSENLVNLKHKKIKRKVSKGRRFLVKVVPFFLLAGLVLLVTAYTVSPLSKQKTFKVTGQEHVSPEQVLAATGLNQLDYTLTAFLKKDQIETMVEDKLIWIEDAKLTYHFPDRFDLVVKEHHVVGYVKDGSSYYPVLSSGDTINEPIGEETLPAQYLLFRLTDVNLIQSFVRKLAEGELLGLAERIQSVDLSPTQASEDLLSLNMMEGHTVLVPLSDLAQKMAYYDSISKQLLLPSYIDMEAGIYTYAK